MSCHFLLPSSAKEGIINQGFVYFSKYTRVERTVSWTPCLHHQSCFIDQVLLFDLWGPPMWSGSSWRFLEEGRGVGRSGLHKVKSLPSWKSVNCHQLESPLMVHYSAGY